MQIEFDFTMKDWMAFQEYFLENNKNNKKAIRYAMISGPVSMLAVLYFFSVVQDDFEITKLIWFIIIFIISWLVLFPKYFKKKMLKNVEKMLSEGDNSNLIGRHKIIFEKDEILIFEPEIDLKIKYTAIKKIEEVEDYYFLFTTTVSSIVIPKRQIEDKLEDLDKIISTCRNSLPKHND